ncbi:hypothetical protein CABS01_14337, partial [Colletotrichum abscissum]|uniref:uncharacterized protein n=1 Tax=Colletotrichum abscissum TaxID=1671311 RepID=UPI0027D745D2
SFVVLIFGYCSFLFFFPPSSPLCNQRKRVKVTQALIFLFLFFAFIFFLPLPVVAPAVRSWAELGARNVKRQRLGNDAVRPCSSGKTRDDADDDRGSHGGVG